MLSKKSILFIAILWTLLVTILSLIGVKSFGSLANSIKIANKDKIVHFIFYFVMAILWLNYLVRTSSQNIYTKVLLATVSYGVLMEVCQGVFTTNREADVFDAIVNTIGAMSGIMLMMMLSNNKN